MFRKIVAYVRSNPPVLYGVLYFTFIPLFAIIYCLQPCDAFKTDLNMHNFVTALYFSTVTITTLGFGDISPVSIFAQITVILESLTGLFTIGLFLNSLAQDQSARITALEREKLEHEVYIAKIAHILRYSKLLQLSIDDYLMYTWAMTTPIANRKGKEVKVNPDFIFKDMVDMFGPSLLGADMSEAVIKSFFRKQATLVADFKNFLTTVDMQHWPKLEEACQNFLENCNTAGISEGITQQGENANLRRTIQRYITEEKDDPDYYSYGHILNPVIVIYKLIKENLLFFDEFEIFIAKLNQEFQEFSPSLKGN